MDVDVVETRALLQQRLRCIAFTARRAGLSRAELDEQLDIADAAMERQEAAAAAERPPLRLVPSAG